MFAQDGEVNQSSDPSLKEKVVIEAVANRICHPDCQNGFILSSYPETVKQLLSLKDILKRMGAKVLPLFFQIDSETMRLLRTKWDRWIAPSTGKSYHVLSSPPKRMIETGNAGSSPLPEFMIDDETGEQLVQLEQDTVASYQRRFQQYKLKELPLYSHFSKRAIYIQGCTHQLELQR